MKQEYLQTLSELGAAGDDGYRISLAVADIERRSEQEGIAFAAEVVRFLGPMLVLVAAGVWLYDLSLFVG